MTTQDAAGVAGLYRKINQVMAAVDMVAKKGRNDFHRYDYATEADILTAIRGAMIEQGLVVIPSVQETLNIPMPTLNGKDQGPITQLTIEFALYDSETGHHVTACVVGQGQDTSDKGVYKAFTGANKYFLLKTFMIPTGDDPEREVSPPPPSNGNPTTRQNSQRPAAVVKSGVR